MVNDQHIRLQTRSALEAVGWVTTRPDTVVPLRNIVEMKIDHGLYCSKQLSLEYTVDKGAIEELKVFGQPLVRTKQESPRLGLVDSMDGFDMNQINALHSELRSRWQQQLKLKLEREATVDPNADFNDLRSRPSQWHEWI